MGNLKTKWNIKGTNSLEEIFMWSLMGQKWHTQVMEIGRKPPDKIKCKSTNAVEWIIIWLWNKAKKTQK